MFLIFLCLWFSARCKARSKIKQPILCTHVEVVVCLQALAKRTRKFSTSVELAFHLTTHLRGLWSSSNSYTSRRKFFTIWPPNATRHLLIASQLYMCEIYDFLRLASRLANPFHHPSQVRTQTQIYMRIKLISIWKSLHWHSLRNRGERQLGKGL